MIKLKSISILIYIALTMQLSSCCYGVKCECSYVEPSIELTFNMDSTNASGFKRIEIENALFIKFNKSGSIIDTTKLISNEYYSEQSFKINDYRATQVKTFQDTCSYRVINSVGNVDLLVSDIIFNGEFAGGCCDCYKNESISFKVNGEQQNLGGNGRSGASYLIYKK